MCVLSRALSHPTLRPLLHIISASSSSSSSTYSPPPPHYGTESSSGARLRRHGETHSWTLSAAHCCSVVCSVLSLPTAAAAHAGCSSIKLSVHFETSSMQQVGLVVAANSMDRHHARMDHGLLVSLFAFLLCWPLTKVGAAHHFQFGNLAASAMNQIFQDGLWKCSQL